MVTAIILLSVKAGREKEIISNLLEEEEITEANIVYGQYDIVVKVEMQDSSQLQDFIIDKIRSLEGVEQTATLVHTL